MEHKDEDRHQLEPRHVDKILRTQMTASPALLTHLVIMVEVVDRVFSNKLTVMSLRMLKAVPPSDSSGSYCCPICGLPTRVLWVACDSCDRWFHAECTDIDADNFCNLHNVDWVCNGCV